MTVKLITMTDNALETISYCARVSNPQNQDNFKTADGLLRYCLRKKHWSIFEMVNIVFEVNAPRDISRQILRHDNNFQEFSQRYADPTQLGMVRRECRLQDETNRQNSLECTDDALNAEWAVKQAEVISLVNKHYKWALDNKIAKECARVILPEGLTMSRMYINGTLRNWIHYSEVRKGVETQKEHREIASACWDILVKEFEFLKP